MLFAKPGISEFDWLTVSSGIQVRLYFTLLSDGIENVTKLEFIYLFNSRVLAHTLHKVLKLLIFVGASLAKPKRFV